jgi:sigma-B regulation protein RsbU (phosphoserine phosphatase)
LQQAALALETSQLLEERTQQAELERELEIAAGVQERLLPKDLKFAAGWEVAAACLPARIVGGDFYAQLPGAEHPAVIYGDVSGKSVSGALMMMAAHEALHAFALTHPDPNDLFRLTNRRLYSLGKRSFVALAYFVAAGEKLRYLLAGQPPPLLRRAKGDVRELSLPDQRLPLGALAEGDYAFLEVDVAPGDLVLGYSDGVTDAQSPTGELFGSDRLRTLLAGSTEGPEEVVKRVLDEIDTFTRGGLQYDDVTLVAVGRQPEASK